MAQRDSKADQLPIAVVVSGISWYVVGATCCLAAFGGAAGGDLRSGLVGSDLVSSAVGHSPRTLLLVLAIAVWTLDAALVLGQRWAVLPLVVLTGSLVIGFATFGAWSTLVLMAALVVGTAPHLFGSARSRVTSGQGA